MFRSIIKSKLICIAAASILFIPNVLETAIAQGIGADFPGQVETISPQARGTNIPLLDPLPGLLPPPIIPGNIPQSQIFIPQFPDLPNGFVGTPVGIANTIPEFQSKPKPPPVYNPPPASWDLNIDNPVGSGGLTIEPVPILENHDKFLASLGLPPEASHHSIMQQVCALLGVSLANCASNSTSYSDQEKTELLGALMMVIANIGGRDPSTWDEHERALISWVEDRIQAQQIDYAKRNIAAWEKFKADYEKSVLGSPKFSQLIDTGPDPANFDSPALYDWSLSQEKLAKNFSEEFANSPALVGYFSGVGAGVGVAAGLGIGLGSAVAAMSGGSVSAVAGGFLTSIGAGVGATTGAMVGAVAAPAAVVVVAVAVLAVVGTKIKKANQMEAAVYEALETARNTRPNFHEMVTAGGAEDGIALALMDAFFGDSSTSPPGSTISFGGLTLTVAN